MVYVVPKIAPMYKIPRSYNRPETKLSKSHYRIMCQS